MEARKNDYNLEVEKLKHDYNLKFEDLKHNQDIEDKIEFAVRTDRITVYKDLWNRLKPLARFPRFEEMEYDELEKLSSDLSVWYHEVGGIFLSESSRPRYRAIQSKIAVVLEENKGKKVPSTAVNAIASDEAHELRNSLVDDVWTRRESKFKES